MKKIFALTLAAVMAMGSATVAFATVTTTLVQAPLFPIAGKSFNEIAFAKDPKTEALASAPIGAAGAQTASFKKGTTLYVPLQYEVAGTPTTSNGGAETDLTLDDDVAGTVAHTEMTAKEMKKYKVKADMIAGKDVIEKTAIEYVKLSNGNYVWAVAIYTNTEYTTKLEDVSGDLVIYKTSPKTPNVASDVDADKTLDNAAMDGEGKIKLDFTSYGFAATNINTATANKSAYVLDNDEPVRSFTDKDNITIEIENIGTIDVNVESQDKMNLAYSLSYIPEIGDKYADNANLEFLNFKAAPSFYKTAVINLYTANKDAVVYSFADGKLTKLESAYNVEDEAVKFATKKLGTFVISDKELDTKLVETAKPIPDTGR